MKKRYFLIFLLIIILIFLFLLMINPFVRINPYHRNPLSALIYFYTLEPAKIELIVKGRNGAEDIRHVFPNYENFHKIPVLGLYAKYKNQVIIVAHYKNGKEKTKKIKIKTKKSNKNSYITILKKNDNKTKYHYLTNGTVYDENGEVRFEFIGEGDNFYYFKNEIISENRVNGLIRYSMLGKELKRYSYPQYFTSFTHGMGQKPNGNFLVIGSFANETILIDGENFISHNDFIIELDYKTGEMVNKIDLAELLNPQRAVIVPKNHIDYGLNDWCHVNGVDYDNSDNSIVVSCRHSGIIKIDEKTHELKWIISPNKGFEKSGRAGKGPDISNKVLTAINSKGIPYKKEIQQGAYTPDFKWPTMNHNVKVYPNNIITVYDNAGPIYDKNVFTTKNSIASIYKINENKKTIKQLWKKDLKIYSDAGSNVLYYPDRNEVVVYSSAIHNTDDELIHGLLTRYDLNTQKILFSAIIDRRTIYFIYRVENFQFYPEEE